ncbi:hypothetical protein MAR_025405 [Mya arenaria]|uniref:Uncharacterized protein n=1 Tax=Mya arenaria TaxID=6604 RepID=A0ABY7DTG6_MYAAR|nr:hypothetical protein MAR_025405 [Mya arenaria]
MSGRPEASQLQAVFKELAGENGRVTSERLREFVQDLGLDFTQEEIREMTKEDMKREITNMSRELTQLRLNAPSRSSMVIAGRESPRKVPSRRAASRGASETYAAGRRSVMDSTVMEEHPDNTVTNQTASVSLPIRHPTENLSVPPSRQATAHYNVQPNRQTTEHRIELLKPDNQNDATIDTSDSISTPCAALVNKMSSHQGRPDGNTGDRHSVDIRDVKPAKVENVAPAPVVDQKIDSNSNTPGHDQLNTNECHNNTEIAVFVKPSQHESYDNVGGSCGIHIAEHRTDISNHERGSHDEQYGGQLNLPIDDHQTNNSINKEKGKYTVEIIQSTSRTISKGDGKRHKKKMKEPKVNDHNAKSLPAIRHKRPVQKTKRSRPPRLEEETPPGFRSGMGNEFRLSQLRIRQRVLYLMWRTVYDDVMTRARYANPDKKTVLKNERLNNNNTFNHHE